MGGPDDLVGTDAAALAGVPVSIAYVGWTLPVPIGLPIDALECPSKIVAMLQHGYGGGNDDEVTTNRFSNSKKGIAYNLQRINSPIDLKQYDVLRFINKKERHRPRLVIGRISRLVPEKAPGAFIYIAQAVKQEYTKSYETARVPLSVDMLPRFVLVGEGVLFEELQALTVQLGVDDMVELRGGISPDAVPEMLASFDIFLYPTFGDSFG
jgi:glycosyltransferase involved in cell wall biosynthesis